MSQHMSINRSNELCQSFSALQTELLGRLKRTACHFIRSSGLDEGAFRLNRASLTRCFGVNLFSFAAGTSDLELVYEATISGKLYCVQATASCFRGSIDVDAMLFRLEGDHWLCYASEDRSWVRGPGMDYFDDLLPQLA